MTTGHQDPKNQGQNQPKSIELSATVKPGARHLKSRPLESLTVPFARPAFRARHSHIDGSDTQKRQRRGGNHFLAFLENVPLSLYTVIHMRLRCTIGIVCVFKLNGGKAVPQSPTHSRVL